MENSFAVITSASSGIGFELAKQFGNNGFDLMIASSSDDIFETQKELEDLGFEVSAIKVNLATYAGVENLYQRIMAEGREIDAITINAGVGISGDFIETDLKEEINLINMNVVSPVHLMKKILPDMKLRGEGKILFTSSIASSSQSEAVYGASKSFLTSFGESLRNELKDSGLTVTIFMPNQTNSQNDPEEAARQGFDALMAGRGNVVSGSLLSKIQDYALRVLPGSTHH